ncbi:ABC transporter ATP-binding protein [Halalkalibacterium halodurans]|uniref:ABC transporter ATP-binding protein n=1 Tax=Halalkalibacterium halodurans TaxID=86665 RepID=UPI002E1D004E|nr:ABC transporter ATP-binding protein [Halalkalibacterium halodurans]MED4083304.1 ABC transporter ATP-binding protein [Halalkalibacterium halodurans]MED4106505.1 ABC transporter ATP-binding protein [Halalkalibacterium halodurans]MED4108740.1 ABC transporter ATP-binding protein [Halalkalibacterium halodurans]MED4122699.1 ABC transporter ATP-binding protein [Halalkalibacterium halodurans]
MANPLTEPFRYRKIPINETEGSEKKKVRPAQASKTLRRIWTYLVNYRGRLLLVFLAVLLSSVLGLLGPFVIGMAIDHYLVEGDTSSLFKVMIGLLAIYAVYSLSMWLQQVWMIGIAQQTVYSIRSDLFHHFHRLPIPFFDKKQHGELMSRMTNDIENISNTLNSSVIQIFSSVLTLVGIMIVMLWLSPLMTVITMTVVPLMVFGLKWITRRTAVFFKQQQKALGDLNGYIEETVSGQSVIQAFSREGAAIATFSEKNRELKTTSFWAQTYTGFIPKVMNVLNSLNFAVIAGVGGILAMRGSITIGIIVIFAEYARQFTRPLNDLANQFNMLLAAIAGAERVFDILDEQEERHHDQTKQVKSIKGEVSFEQVSFSYEQKTTLNNLSFHVNPGETVALIGPTGAGKTTIIRLLSRFYEWDGGAIYVDGEDVTTWDRESYRRHLAFVLQESFLFQGTIRENIRYGRLEATDEEVEAAAKMANAHSFIMRLPDQYDTVLDSDGSGISQGQKQLLSIARAMIANPSILILDEATSNIDTITELNIQEALHRLMNGRTSFVIAHRLNTIQHADVILVLEKGTLVEQGSHEELMAKKGVYYDMIDRGQQTLAEGEVIR